MRSIILFDDNEDERRGIAGGLARLLGDGARVEQVEDIPRPPLGASYETHISTWLDGKFRPDEIGLLACDKELGRYGPGLSATAITTVARDKGIPCCQYSRQAAEGGREFAGFLRLRRWGTEDITLEGTDVDRWAAEIAALFTGFEEIRAAYPGVAGAKTPAAALAAILRHPEAESRIALYGSGDQGFLVETLALFDADQKPDKTQVQMRMTRVLGNWLSLSILRFPGILVDRISAPSYLNTDPEAFARKEVQALFEPARYSGPFAELGPWWWRTALDAILEEQGCADGQALAAKHRIEVPPCLDPQTRERAGLYCMLTRLPVSPGNSRGGISWFPSGADLARIRKAEFDQITALVGMY